MSLLSKWLKADLANSFLKLDLVLKDCNSYFLSCLVELLFFFCSGLLSHSLGNCMTCLSFHSPHRDYNDTYFWLRTEDTAAKKN